MGIIASLILAFFSIVDPTGGYLTTAKTQTTVDAKIVDPTGGYLISTQSQTTVNTAKIVDPTGGY